MRNEHADPMTRNPIRAESRRQSRVRCWAHGGLPVLLVLAFGLYVGTPVLAEDLVWVSGRVVGTDNQPLPDTMVAVYDDSNKVIDYARTDKNGEYALAVPRYLLHLPGRSGGFFTEVAGGVTRFVGGAADFVASPLRAGVNAVTAAEVADSADLVTKGGIAAGGAIANQLFFPGVGRDHKPAPLPERKQPGALLIKVVSNGGNDLVGVNHVYWMQQEKYKTGGKQQNTLAAWLDPIRLTPTASDKPSSIESEYMRFKEARLQPSLAQPGQRVRLSVRFPLPPDPPVYVVVVARNIRTGQMWELSPTGEGRYETEFEVDKRFPRDDQTICVLAYAAKYQTPGRRPDAEGAIAHAGLWDPKKPYAFDPLLLVSRNRAEVTLTVLAPDKKR